MIDSKIAKLYNIMDTNEKRDLQIWLNNKLLWSQKKGDNKDILYLNDCLTKYSKRGKKLVESTQKFTKDKLNQLSYQLFHIVENFLLLNWLSKKADKKQDYAIQKQMLTLAFYQEKELGTNSKHNGDLSKLIDLKLKDVSNLLNKVQPDSIDNFLHLYKLNHHLYYGQGANIWQNGKPYLEELLFHLDTFYTTAKMRYFTESMYRAKINSEVFESTDLHWLEQKANDLYTKFNKTEKQNPLLALYHLCFELSINTNKENLFLLSNEIIEQADFLHLNDLSTILTFTLNYTFFISRNEGIDLADVQFKMFQLGLEKSVFLSNGLLQPLILINYVHLCTEVRQAEEIEIAWQKYQFHIENDYKESTLNLCMAHKSFAENRFEKAIDLMNRESKRKLRFFLSKKLLQIKCNYELSDYVTLEEERNNMLRYLRKNKNYSLYDSFYNFTQLIRDLANPDIGKTEMLKKVKINTVEKRWIIRKISEK